ncbi:GPR1/FUN34/yaaH family-domain-containing protein [Zychaea mexicana]|uniref:GPR1/FUN34/yaaH family-domain-containing protein n=1 Tax=Zychaea mexicana TaxID=64656 RepID=UPI0022FDBDAF|nr:GPR1/FUN34/yaaH family-domain-containing protein [Zychaea mexicana]KAI9484395.1 GPR1/FUN34/yaaH family-domain-containing protein [Zychaea mexicana]
MSTTEQPQDLEKVQVPQQAPPPAVARRYVIANPGPLGLSSFALTTFVLSLHNGGAGFPASSPSNVVVGLAFFYGGLVQLLAGMWEFATGNTFGATAFSSYGGFWLSYALIFIPGANIEGAYADSEPDVFKRSMTIYLISWAIVTAMLLIASHRSSIGMVLLFFALLVTFILLAAAEYNSSIPTKVAAGSFGVITSVIAWYNALSGMLTKESSYFLLPMGKLP